MFRHRLIDDTRKFGFWRWQEILDDPEQGPYITKLYLWRTPWQQTSIHWLHRKDPGGDLHDHPRSFISILLRGGYTEQISVFHPVQWFSDTIPYVSHVFRSAFSIAFRKAETAHAIVDVDPGTVSLVLWGRKRRPWGFHTRLGWVPWKVYCGIEEP